MGKALAGTVSSMGKALAGTVSSMGKALAGTVRCDNQAVVSAVSARSCRDPNLMHLLQCLFFFESHFQFVTHIEHIPGKDNSLVGDLSRDNIASFMQHSKVRPESTPTSIPPPLREMLLKTTPDWNSPSWRQLFKDTL